MYRTPIARRIATVFALLLLTAAGSAAADQVAACTEQAEQAAVATAGVGEIPAPVPMEIDGPSAQSDCDAECWDGSSVTCSGPSCTARDSDCSAGERGHCTSGSFRKDCPPCEGPACSATASCDNGGTASCSGNTCFALDGCYAYCEDSSGDGFYVWCFGESPSTCPLL